MVTVAPATADGGTTTAGARQETLAPAAAGVAGAGAEVSEGGGQGRAEEDPLESMIAEAEGRKRGRQEMLAFRPHLPSHPRPAAPSLRHVRTWPAPHVGPASAAASTAAARLAISRSAGLIRTPWGSNRPRFDPTWQWGSWHRIPTA